MYIIKVDTAKCEIGSILAAHMIGTKVLLNNGKIGEVVYVPHHVIEKPVICVDSLYIDLTKDGELQIESLI